MSLKKSTLDGQVRWGQLWTGAGIVMAVELSMDLREVSEWVELTTNKHIHN